MTSTRYAFSDPELIKAVRYGEISAFASLYARHVGAAYRLARVLTPDVEEGERLVADCFSRVRLAMLAGGGPTVIFRTYLLSMMRSTSADAASTKPVNTLAVDGVLDATSQPVAGGSLAAHALTRLPARWQLLLWHLDVEGEPAEVVGPMLGLLPTEVSKLAIRARERLRAAYFREMEDRALTDECSWVAQRLAAGVSENPSDPDRGRLDYHIARCDRCWELFAEFYRLDHELSSVLAHLVLGDLAADYCAGGRSTNPPTPDRRASAGGAGRRLRRAALVVAAFTRARRGGAGRSAPRP